LPTLFPQLACFTDLGLLLLRLMAAFIFATSRWNHKITMIVTNLVIVSTGGGRYGRMR